MAKTIVEEDLNNLEALLGKTVTLYCCRYIYTGTLKVVDDFSVKLEGAKIVYETGSFDESEWKNCKKFPQDVWFVAKQSIESFGILK
jgi:hypothetical protein